MKNENILDHQYNDFEDLKKALLVGGFKKCYTKENGSVVVQESDVVQVSVHLDNGEPLVKTKFPQIGNSVQIISTIILLVLLGYLGVPTLVMWASAIIGGQVISYGWFMPKIIQLKKKVEDLL